MYSVLFSIELVSSRSYVFDHLIPFELEVLHAKPKYWTGDFVGYLDTIYWVVTMCSVVKKCKLMAKMRVGGRERREGASVRGSEGGMVEGPRDMEFLSPRCGGREGAG